MLSSTADRTVVAPIVNGVLLFLRVGNPQRKYPLRTTGTMTTALTACVASAVPQVMIMLNPATVFVDPGNFTVMDFGGTSLTGRIRTTAPRTGAGT